ncbi:ABC transporter substrate-binding protein [Paenibacillus cremeus]|uniref:Extracellular solute-binding protein n=1 Tax=Paenibacillus cremeus TaxID=2163881 RepID=A0A559K0C9_9BACL|nr:extracellular solute-binding protein [Paenibacillus cremeus]TVY05604.1 extracellular solute-binding protein [Paenibacillus cremeus]
MRKKNMLLWMTTITSMMVTACSGGNPSTSEQTPQTPTKTSVQIGDAKLDAAELVILSKVASITQEEFERTMAAPIRAKYPNYKLKYIIEGKDVTLDKMMVAGQAPDITITSLGGLQSSLLPLSLEYDLTDLIKKYNYDMSRIEPSTIESLKNATTKGGIYGLPKYLNTVVLFYNKDLFNKFGVPVPKDGMTWDEAIRLSGTMTRVENGEQIRGMSLFYSNMVLENQLSLPLIDPKEDKSAVNVPGFQKLLTTFKAIYDIPGNKPEGDFTPDSELTQFQKKRNVAMVAAPMSGYGRFEADPDLNWDVVAAPTFADAPKVGYQPNTIYYFVSNANKKAEQAFQVVTELLSDDVQLQANKEARPTILNNEKIRATLGSDHKLFKDKNFKAVFYNKFAPMPPANAKMAPLVNASSILQGEFVAMIKNGSDINTALRTAEDKINQAITSAKSK